MGWRHNNKYEDPLLSLRDNELATFFSGAIKMQMDLDV